MAGQCRPSPIFKEVTLKGGINAGTYKDVGGVQTMEECQNKCCEFPACDLAFMLAGSCYLVGCYDQKQCAMQPAKESKFHPMISYVTRWNNEGVKHTVLLQEKGVQYTCSKMNPLVKVTLKGGLQSGDFTDVGKVTTLQQCYDICCQQEKCDLAFMLGQNCFSVQCKDKRLCMTTPAQPSIFNPQIAYVPHRERMGIAKSGIARAPVAATTTGVSAECPKTKTLEKMTLKGGVDAGAYKDHGKVKDMEVCRRICCEMTECHLAFMLGTNCFSVKCANVDACRAQKAKPSAYYPKISYIRKVGTNELLPSSANLPAVDTAGSDKPTASSVPSLVALAAAQQTANPQQKAVVAAAAVSTTTTTAAPEPAAQASMLGNGAQGYAVTPNGLKPIVAGVQLPGQTIDNTTNAAAVNVNPIQSPGASSANTTTTEAKVAPPEQKSVEANAPPSQGLEQNKDTEGLLKNDTVKPETQVSVKDQELMSALEAAENVTQKSNIMPVQNEKCKPGILKTNVTLRGGRKAGEFIEIQGLKDMKGCVKRCCDDRDKKCNLAFMLGDTCYSVSCKDKDLCRTMPAPPTKFNPLVQYVRGLEEEPMPSTTASTTTIIKDVDLTNLDSLNNPTENVESKVESKPKTKSKQKSCVTQPIVKDKSIKGGKKAGKFKIFKDIKDMDSCIAKCCSLKKQCDVAYMEDAKCFSIQCFKKTACTAVDLRESEVNPRFAYMDHFLEKVDEEEAENDISTDLDISEDSACLNVEIATNKTLKGGTRAGKFKSMGKKTMKKCINSCCDRPDCDVAYLLNGHCYAVECADGRLCQATGEPSKAGDNIQLAYMNKVGLGEKQRDYMIVYIIVGSLAFVATLGGLIWAVFAFSRKQRIKRRTHKRLLDDDEDEEPIEHILKKRPHHTRYRQPRY